MADKDVIKSSMNVFFDPKDPFYKEHFPSHAVVPGSFILEAFITTIHQSEIKRPVKKLKKIQFKTFASPGHYEITTTLIKETIFCELKKEETLFAKAVFTL